MPQLRPTGGPDDERYKPDDNRVPLSARIGTDPAAADTRGARASGLVQDHAAKDLQHGPANGTDDGQEVPALHRCDDVRVSHSADRRYTRRGRDAELGSGCSGRGSDELLALADRLSR